MQNNFLDKCKYLEKAEQLIALAEWKVIFNAHFHFVFISVCVNALILFWFLRQLFLDFRNVCIFG